MRKLVFGGVCPGKTLTGLLSSQFQKLARVEILDIESNMYRNCTIYVADNKDADQTEQIHVFLKLK